MTPETRPGAPDTATPRRPPVVAMVVVGLLGVAILALFLRSAGLGTRSFDAALLDEEEALVDPGVVTLDLGTATVQGELQQSWIIRERCPGWIQLTARTGDATTLHVIATTGAPDLASRELVEVSDYPAWLEQSAGITMVDPVATQLVGRPALAGALGAGDGASEDALVAACREADGSGGSGIRGPAAGFEQYLVATTVDLDEIGSLLVLAAAWVGGDIELATAEAIGLAESLAVVDP